MTNERETLLIMDKSFEQIMEEALQELAKTPISNGGPGGIARLLLSIINQHVADFYKALSLQHAQAFLSMAKDDNVDRIGALLDCHRIPGESDDDYKFRISRQTLSMAKANQTAVRLAALSVEGVEDVIMRRYTFGTGSFSVYPVTSDPYDPRLPDIMEEMQWAVDDVKSMGVRGVVLEPRLSFVEIKGRLKFSRALSDMDRSLIQDRATNAVRRYINALPPGEEILISEIRRLVLGADEAISGLELFHFVIDGEARLIVDQISPWNTRFIEAEERNSIQFI